jgi:hypothetical protein
MIGRRSRHEPAAETPSGARLRPAAALVPAAGLRPCPAGDLQLRMLTVHRSLRHAALLALVLVGASAPAAAGAQPAACPGESIAQVFLPWADPAWYASVPDGGLEAGGAGWRLRGVAAVVEGNEPFHVRAPGDSRALALAPGGAASSPAACVGPGHPTLRFFARSERAANTSLAVTVELTDPAGNVRSLPIGLIAPTPAWQPSPILLIVTNALTLLGPQQAVFKFTPRGEGSWYIDDVYVDPYGKG